MSPTSAVFSGIYSASALIWPFELISRNLSPVKMTRFELLCSRAVNSSPSSTKSLGVWHIEVIPLPELL